MLTLVVGIFNFQKRLELVAHRQVSGALGSVVRLSSVAGAGIVMAWGEGLCPEVGLVGRGWSKLHGSSLKEAIITSHARLTETVAV